MFNKFKIISFVVVFTLGALFFGSQNPVNAADLNWSADQTIDLSSPDVNLTILSGSEATSLVVNAGNISVVVATGDTFTVTSTSSALSVAGNTTATITNTCIATNTQNLLILGGLGGETIVITPTGVQCDDGSGGGGGGGGGGSRKVPVPVALVNPPGCMPGFFFSPVTGERCESLSLPVSLLRYYNFGPVTLKNGSIGEGVKELQRFLNDTMNLGLVVDGIFGSLTHAVVQNWQINNGLVADGLVGPATKARMNAGATTPFIPAIPSPATPGIVGVYAFGTVTIVEGTQGEECRAWQQFFNDKMFAGLVVDGNCGPRTIAAAKAWQLSVGLAPDGRLGPISRAKASTQ